MVNNVRRSTSPSGQSNADTSFSQELIEGLNPDDTMAILPALSAASEELFKLLKNDWKEIRKNGSKSNKRYQGLLEEINLHRKAFGFQEYIQPRIVLRLLLGVQSMDELLAASWRSANSIILRINLAMMLNSILVTCDPSNPTEAGSGALLRLDTLFPSVIADGEYTEDAMSFALSIAEQVVIAKFEEEIGSSDSLIDDVLYDDGDSKHAVSLGLDKVDDATRDHALAMVREVEATLRTQISAVSSSESEIPITDELKSLFPWHAFRERAIQYSERRAGQLDPRIRTAGGAARILQRLSDAKEARELRQLTRKKSPAPRSSFGDRASLQLVQNMEKSAAPIAQMVPRPSQGDRKSSQVNRSQDTALHTQTQAPPATQLIQRTAAQPSRLGKAADSAPQEQAAQQSEPARPRSFFDSQPNATQVSWDDDSQPQQTRPQMRGEGIISRQSGPSVLGKRALVPYDFEPTQDEGFQSDTRDHSAAAHRRKEVSFAPRPSQSRYDATTTRSSILDQTNPPPITSPSKRRRQNPGSSIPPPFRQEDLAEAEAPGNSLFARAKIAARNRTVVSTMNPPQMRRAWSEAEENALIDMIVQHGDDGISYSGLKALDNERKLARRTAEDLRFKARNMKVTMLK